MADRPIVVRLDRELYYDGEEVTGDVTFNGIGPRPRSYKTVMIILWARYVEFDGGVTREAFTLHMLKMPVAQELEIQPGETKAVPFQFIIPANSPPTYAHRTGAVQWRVAVVHENPLRKACRAVASKAFRKGSLYFSVPAFLPTAQSEVVLPASKHMLRAEAKLTKDVYSTDEEIGVHVTIHEEETHKLPSVTSVKAKVVQYASAQKANFHSSVHYKLCKATQDISSWEATHLGNDRGCVVENTITLKPTLSDPVPIRPKCAHQVVSAPTPENRTAPHKSVLAPTCKFSGRDGQKVNLTYAVKVEVRTPSGHDLTLILPFVMQGAREEAAKAALRKPGVRSITEETPVSETEAEEALEKLAGFCNIDDDLPDYEEVEKLSLPSYTTLRRNSIDTVFAAADPSPPVYTSRDTLALPPGFSNTPAGLARFTQRRHSSIDLKPHPTTIEEKSDDENDNNNNNLAATDKTQNVSAPSVLAVPSPTAAAHNRGRRASLSVLVGGLFSPRVEKTDAVIDPRIDPPVTSDLTAGHEDSNSGSNGSGSGRPRRRSSAVGLILENPVAAGANRAMRRLRAATHSGAVPGALATAYGAGASGAQRRRSKDANSAEETEDPDQVFASFKARYMQNTPVEITLDTC